MISGDVMGARGGMEGMPHTIEVRGEAGRTSLSVCGFLAHGTDCAHIIGNCEHAKYSPFHVVDGRYVLSSAAWQVVVLCCASSCMVCNHLGALRASCVEMRCPEVK